MSRAKKHNQWPPLSACCQTHSYLILPLLQEMRSRLSRTRLDTIVWTMTGCWIRSGTTTARPLTRHTFVNGVTSDPLMPTPDSRYSAAWNPPIHRHTAPSMSKFSTSPSVLCGERANFNLRFVGSLGTLPYRNVINWPIFSSRSAKDSLQALCVRSTRGSRSPGRNMHVG